jgi:cardiolipin synthase
LAPKPRKKPKKLGAIDYWDRARYGLRSWGIWLVLAFAFAIADSIYWAIGSGIAAVLFYITKPIFHSAIYPVECTLKASSCEFRQTMVGMTGAPFMPGNRTAFYNNGDSFYPPMLEDIERAEQSVTMEQYIFWPGKIGRRFCEVFSEKARQGVPVKLLVDAIGSSTLGEQNLRILEAGGVHLAWYHPIRWYTLDRANHRTHRKSVIIDGRIGFTGGAGIADHWLGVASSRDEWRDMMMRIEGPAVPVLQSGFAQNWLVTTGEILTGARYFPEIEEVGETEVQTILSSPIGGAGAAATSCILAIEAAERTIDIANPYFIPPPAVLDLLARAIDRGVRMRLMLAGDTTDTWWARHNSSRLYGRMMRAGVDIFEYMPTMMHHKFMIVDNCWATFGTTNFDNRSFALNEESNICVDDPEVVKQLCSVFEEDLKHCKHVTGDVWRGRGVLRRLSEATASLLHDQV